MAKLFIYQKEALDMTVLFSHIFIMDFAPDINETLSLFTYLFPCLSLLNLRNLLKTTDFADWEMEAPAKTVRPDHIVLLARTRSKVSDIPAQ